MIGTTPCISDEKLENIFIEGAQKKPLTNEITKKMRIEKCI